MAAVAPKPKIRKGRVTPNPPLEEDRPRSPAVSVQDNEDETKTQNGSGSKGTGSVISVQEASGSSKLVNTQASDNRPSSAKKPFKANTVEPSDKKVAPQNGRPVTPTAWNDKPGEGSPKSRPRSGRSMPPLLQGGVSPKLSNKNGRNSPQSTVYTGSFSSMHSIITVEEARPESRLDGVSGNGVVNGDTKALVSASNRSLQQQPILEEHNNAYVPYLYARDCLAKVMDDMKRMKLNHVKIVHEIKDNYQQIEDETQGQFNTFVISLRENYSSKVKTFKQVIEVHRTELSRHQVYWDETLASLSNRNKQLLKDKKRLLIINKVEIDRLEKEKETIVTDLTHKIDKEHQKYVLSTKELENLKKQHEEELAAKEKIRKDEVESEKKESERLMALLAAKPTTVTATGYPATTAAAKPETTTAGAVAATAVMSSVITKSLEEEERKKYEAEIQSSEKELAIMKAKYAALQTQFQLVAAAAAQDKEKTEETIVVVATEKEELKEEKSKVEKEIKDWENDFQKKKGREPTEKEKTKSLKKLNEKSVEMEKKIQQLDVQIETLTTVKEGKVPEPVEVTVPEPVIKTVEVKVQDPVLVAAVAATEQQSAELRQRVQELEETLKEKNKTIKQLEKDKKKLGRTKSSQQLPVKNIHTSKDEKNLKILLEAVIRHVHGVHGEVKKAADKTSSRLKESEGQKKGFVETRDKIKEDIEKWVEKFTEENDKEPTEEDRDSTVENLYSRLDKYNTKCLTNETDIVALTMMKTGEIPEEFGVLAAATVTAPGAVAGASAEEIQELEEKIKILMEENEDMNKKNSELEDKNSDLEDKVDELQEQTSELQGQLAIARAAGGVAAGVAVTPAAAAVPGVAAVPVTADLDEDVEELGEQMTALQRQVDDAEARLREEKLAHSATKEEVEDLKLELERLRGDVSGQYGELEARTIAKQKQLEDELRAKNKDLSEAKQKMDELEQEKLKNVPVDSAKEIRKLQEKVKKAEAEKQASEKARRAKTAELDEIKPKVTNLSQLLAKEREINRGHQDKLKQKMADKDREMKEQAWQIDKKATERADEEKKRTKALEKKIKELQSAVAAGGGVAAGGKGGTDDAKVKKLQDQIATMKKQVKDDQEKIKQFERDAKEARVAAAQDKSGKKAEKQIKELEKKFETEKKKFEREQKRANDLDEELGTTKKDLSSSQEENKKLNAELAALGVAAKEGIAAAQKVTALESEVKKLNAETKTLTDNWNSERVLRKKYYNMVEDMKGKIRVYCRARPLSGDELGRGNISVIKSPDEYTIEVSSNRGLKEFQYDQIFTAESTQEKVFEDTNNLIQSAFDGYNVCIFAYGQTGSGKTFTMIGDKDQTFPGITPRAFKQIFSLVDENKKKFTFKISSYMLELYNDKLIDLYNPNPTASDGKLDIKKDKKGMVVVSGAVVQSAGNAKELFGLFEEGSRNRHVASTKMNAESSRSHLIIGVVIESTNLTTGTVTSGKLSLVDLAGSERASKTDASAEQLKEAQSINKSLSALGDVISALSSGQSFIPYRNNKLTMLMQDSLGGNAKTLMFVNISPADYNADETVISLTYASRVKLITNDAAKNADNKEIARLKDIITKLKKGESVEEEAAE